MTGASAGGRPLELSRTPDRIRVRLPSGEPGAPVKVLFAGDLEPRTADGEQRLYAVPDAAQYTHEGKARLHEVLTSDRSAAERLTEVKALGTPDGLFGALAEIVAARP